MAITVTTGGPIVPGATRKPLLTIIQEVCTVIGVAVPTAVFASTVREHVELKALAIEMAERIAFDTHDWTKLRTLATLTGDGVATDFDLPSDYRRMMVNSRLWPVNNFGSPLIQVTDSDEWLEITQRNLVMTPGAWTLLGDTLSITPVLPDDDEVQFYYIKNLYAYAADGTPKDWFTADDDTYALDARLLRLGMIWQWKANKGLPHASDLATYEDALSKAMDSEAGAKPVASGNTGTLRSVKVAWPGQVLP